MNSQCIPENEYMGSPEFLKLSLHITTALATPIHCLGVYFILFKTPEYMKTIRLYLINLHTWIILFDYSVGILTVPVILLPAFAGYPFGLLQTYGVPTMAQTLVVLQFLAYVNNSNIIIFESRFHILCNYPGKSCWSYFRYPWILLHYFVILAGLVLFGFMTPDQSSAVEKVLQTLPCFPQDFYKQHIFVLADDHTYHLVLLVIYILGTCIEALFFVSFTIWHTATQFLTKRMSQKTYQMQKSFFKALLVQMSVPTVMLIIPMIYALIVVVRNHHNQSLTNICIIIASLHGFVSTIVMLFVHRPYREELFHFFTRTSQDSVAPCKSPVFVIN